MSYRENSSNYGNFIFKYETAIRKVVGCNGFVKNISDDFLFLVNKQLADLTLKECGIDLEKLKEESKYFHLDYSQITEDIVWHGVNLQPHHQTYYIFKIPFNRQHNKKHYYTFCYLRHLYYNQSTLINYFKNYQTNVIRKIHNLITYNSHSIFPTYLNVVKKDWHALYTLSFDNSCFVNISICYNATHVNREVVLNLLEALYYIVNGEKHIVNYETKQEYLTENLLQYVSDKNYPFKDRLYLDDTENVDKAVGKFSIYGYIINIMNRKKVFKHRLKLLSRHPTHDSLRALLLCDKTLLRLGSSTKVDESKYQYVLNSIEAIETSKNKLLMKEAFLRAGVKSPEFYMITDLNPDKLKYPMVAKHMLGSRGTGNYLLNSADELKHFIKKKSNIKDFLFERYCNYAYEYRIHVSTLGVFLIWQKLMKRATPESKKWVYNNDNCVFVSKDNASFVRIANIEKLNTLCLNALNAVGLNIGSIDLKINKKGEMTVIEINSAPSLGEIGIEHYKTEIKKLTKCAE